MFHRHDLLWLDPEGRQAALRNIALCIPPDAAMERAAALIGDPRIPAIAASQCDVPPGFVGIGFSSPDRIGGTRFRVSASAPLTSIVRRVDPFQAARRALREGPLRPVLSALIEAGKRSNLETGVFGSLALEAVTGLPYTGDGSDVDIYLRLQGGGEGLASFYQDLLDCEARFARRVDAELEYREGAAINLKELFSPGQTLLAKTGRGPFILEKADMPALLRRASGRTAEETAAFADETAAMMTRALLYEAACAPKPGLVTRLGSGNHRDMDFFTFIDSALALGPFFRDCCRAGADCSGAPESLFPRLRERGREAEAAMFRVTGGVNTHKGIIFSGGIICGAAGFLYGRGMAFDAEDLLDTAGKIAAPALADLRADGSPAAETGGERAFVSHGLTGVRGEAAAGFPSLRSSYPRLRDLRGQGHSLNDAGAAVLLTLMARTGDTNVAARGGIQALWDIQRDLSAFLFGGAAPSMDAMLAYAGELDRRMRESGVSPGGSADLLALSYFLLFLHL